MDKIYFLGQAGLLFKKADVKIIIDPYFSNDVGLVEPKNYRRQRADEGFLSVQPSVLIITHSHLDHYDKTTVEKYLKQGGVTVLSPYSVWSDIRNYAGENEYVLFDEGTSVTLYGITFRAVYAAHSDKFAIGVVINDGDDYYYVTGDTLYSEHVFDSLPSNRFKAVFLPVNGKGNNLNAIDAARFFERLNAQYAVPVHFGMFDELTGNEFKCKNAVIPQIYKEIELK